MLLYVSPLCFVSFDRLLPSSPTSRSHLVPGSGNRYASFLINRVCGEAFKKRGDSKIPKWPTGRCVKTNTRDVK
uniref:Uncharacterized protein n=1 Tax=Anguilla anguilla TaxID=7936 RepID=A0A0E9S6F7_ANGAN